MRLPDLITRDVEVPMSQEVQHVLKILYVYRALERDPEASMHSAVRKIKQ